MRFWWSWIEQRRIDTSRLSALDVWGMAALKKFLCHDWLMLCSPLCWYSLFSRFGGIATVISRLKFLVSGYFIQFPDYHYHTTATTTFSGWAYFVTFGNLNFGLAVPLKYHFNFAFHSFPVGGPEKSSKLNNIILGIWTRTHLEVVNKWEQMLNQRWESSWSGLLHVSPFSLSSSICLANCALVFKAPLLVTVIYF